MKTKITLRQLEILYKLAQYSFEDISTYEELTRNERVILTKKEFKDLRKVLYD